MYDLEQIRSALRSALPDRGSDESSQADDSDRHADRS